MTTAMPRRSALRKSFARRLSAVTATGIPATPQAAFTSAQSAFTGWVRNTAPMLARTVLGL